MTTVADRTQCPASHPHRCPASSRWKDMCVKKTSDCLRTQTTAIRPNQILNLFRDVSRPYRVYIASFGFKPAILKALQKSCIPKQMFDYIITPDDIQGFRDGQQVTIGDKGTKRSMLQKLGLVPQETVLIDDSPDILADAEKAGFLVAPINGSHGITLKDANRIIRALKKWPHIRNVVIDADLTLFTKHITSQYVYDIVQQIPTQRQQYPSRHSIRRAITQQLNVPEAGFVSTGARRLLEYLRGSVAMPITTTTTVSGRPQQRSR